MVDTVTLLVSSAVGLAVDGETVPYVAGWGENGALEAVTEFADTIDQIARRIELAIADCEVDSEAGQRAVEAT